MNITTYLLKKFFRKKSDEVFANYIEKSKKEHYLLIIDNYNEVLLQVDSLKYSNLWMESITEQSIDVTKNGYILYVNKTINYEIVNNNEEYHFKFDKFENDDNSVTEVKCYFKILDQNIDEHSLNLECHKMIHDFSLTKQYEKLRSVIIKMEDIQ